MTAPTKFPYRLKLTTAQRDELVERIDRIRFALTDPVGLSGYHMSLDEGSVANLASHLALAGADLDEERAYIRGRVRDDENAMFRGMVEWVLKKDHPEEPAEEVTDVTLEARTMKAQIDRQLSPAVRAEIARMMLDDYNKATKDGDV